MIRSKVLLQHQLGVLCGNDGEIYIAQSYNHMVDNSDSFAFELLWIWHAMYLMENTNRYLYTSTHTLKIMKF
ncbi:hypothetical protein Fmac_006892 [Flemingia macrophylla]|uniref:Uncharacterized protein n=1 Tax=Flemingia macrophylla TaxID=520843 RepID=A0ABD1NBV5_9FABA